MEVHKTMSKLKYAVPSFVTPNAEGVAYWENFLTSEEINLLLAQPEWLNMEDGVIKTSEQHPVNDATIRRTKVAWLDTKSELKTIWEKFASVTAEVNAQFFRFDLDGFYEPMQICLYEEQALGHYDWHTDWASKLTGVQRKLSVVLLLNDASEFEGGELQVKQVSDVAQTLECKKGRAWFFPSYTLHRVTPVTKGIRRSLVLWCGGKPFC
jgi:PKHD-type hydroxylase